MKAYIYIYIYIYLCVFVCTELHYKLNSSWLQSLPRKLEATVTGKGEVEGVGQGVEVVSVSKDSGKLV